MGTWVREKQFSLSFTILQFTELFQLWLFLFIFLLAWNFWSNVTLLARNKPWTQIAQRIQLCPLHLRKITLVCIGYVSMEDCVRNHQHGKNERIKVKLLQKNVNGRYNSLTIFSLIIMVLFKKSPFAFSVFVIFNNLQYLYFSIYLKTGMLMATRH